MMATTSRRKSVALSHWMGRSSSLLIALFSFISIFTQVAHCSPPIDYFLYSNLPSIKSIYHLEGSNSEPNNNNNQATQNYAARVLSLIQNTSHTHDNDLIDLETTRYAWHLMEEQALHYMRRRVEAVKPTIRLLLNESQVSSDCQTAVEQWLVKLQDLDKWATLMWNSWGDFPPAGLFEGSFTDLGSYRGCLSVPDNEMIEQAQYCILDYQPLVPTRPRFHSVFKKVLGIDEQTNQLTNGDFVTDNGSKISSSHASHGFISTKFRSLIQSKKDQRNSTTKSMQKSPMYLTEVSGGNATLNAGALIELAQRAQYFYYVKFRIGACLPSKCTQADVQKLAQTAGERAILQAGPVNCMKKEPVKLNGYQKTAIWILSSIALIGVIGTITDLLGLKAIDNSFTLVGWLLPFSIWTNARRLFLSNTAASHADLDCIHGLRFFSMLWVIYGHTILYTEYQLYTHAYDIIDRHVPNLLVLPSLNGNFSVDTFFVISGILTTYVTWEHMKGDVRKFNKFAFAISRYIRLTPQLAIVILCFFLLPLFGDGPMYKQITEEQASLCYNNWFINLLYLQCYVNAKKICIDPSWWLSIEMTFHLLSMIVVLTMIKSPRNGMVVNFIVAAVLTIWGAVIHYTNGFAISYLPSIPQKYEIVYEQTKMFFHKPYPHAASYFIGIALGYMLADQTIKKLSKRQIYLGWAGCSSALFICLFSSHFWNLGAPYTQLTATVYYNVCQILWPISIAWIILACSLGHGGFVQSILSARFFVPLGRITYMTYLSHALIIYYHTASMSFPAEPSMLLFAYIYVANTFLSLVLGMILTVLYEVPVLNLQRMIFQRIYSPAQVTVISVADTNGLSNQLIIESDDMENSKPSQERCNDGKNSTSNIGTDNSIH